MTSEEFVHAIKLVVHDAALNGIVNNLQTPHGHRPPTKVVKISKWFCSLGSADKEMVREVARLSVHAAVFGFLSVLDGVQAIENTEDKGEIDLLFRKAGQEFRLNQQAEDLHDVYQSLVWDEVFGD